MPCCGQKRTELRTNNPSNPNQPAKSRATSVPSVEPPRKAALIARPAPAEPPLPRAPSSGEVGLRYLASTPIVAVGIVSRRQYRFSGTAPLQRVLRADVDGLLSSGYFRRES